jgi:hypothetical protein
MQVILIIKKCGAWNQNDPDVDFLENFYSEKDLFLPAGEYTVTLKGDCYLTYSEQNGFRGL